MPSGTSRVDCIVKILYFIDHLRPDGTQHVLQQLVKGLSVRGHQQAIVCLNGSYDQALIDNLYGSGVDVRIVGKRSLVTGYGLVSTLRWMQRERFDVAMTLLFYSDIVGRTLARIARIPRIIAALQARNVHYTQWQRRLVRRTMRWVDSVLVPTADVGDFAVAEEGVARERIRVIPYSVQINDFRTPMDPAMLRNEFGLAPDQCVIASAGRLTRQKGFDVLLAALALVERKDVHLLLAGVGEDEHSLRSQVAQLGLDDRVHFVGYRRDLPRLLGALDLYVHPARWEGMPIVLLSAMAASCPIVATSVDGNRTLIDDGVHGWLVPPDDPIAFAKAIDTALHDRREAERRAHAAYERVLAKFSVEAMVEAWEQVFVGRNS
jgi:glycosyltransferase involved in cell wall biosynthesis